MSFFDEIVEAYRYKVGNAQAEVDAAAERYDAVREEAAAELAKAALDAPEFAPLAHIGAKVHEMSQTLLLWWSSPGEIAEMCIYTAAPGEATLYLAGEEYGRQFILTAPAEDTVRLFLAWVDGDHATVTAYPTCPVDWAETIGVCRVCF